MHFIVSWDIQSKDEKWDEINAQLQECLEDYSWVRPLSTFYIVRVSGQEEWARIKEDLQAVAESSTAKTHFVVSPLMYGGRYDGWLPKTAWPKIRKRTA